MESKTLNITNLAKYLGIPKRTLFDMINDKRFPVKPIITEKPRLWSREQVDKWLRGEND